MNGSSGPRGPGTDRKWPVTLDHGHARIHNYPKYCWAQAEGESDSNSSSAERIHNLIFKIYIYVCFANPLDDHDDDGTIGAIRNA